MAFARGSAGAPAPVTAHLSRVYQSARRWLGSSSKILLNGNPHFEAGGTVEIRGLPRTSESAPRLYARSTCALSRRGTWAIDAASRQCSLTALTWWSLYGGRLPCFFTSDDFRIKAENFDLSKGANILRIICGAFMFPHIAGKFAAGAGLSAGTVGFFAKAGFHPAEAWVYIAATAETIAGIALVWAFVPVTPRSVPQPCLQSPFTPCRSSRGLAGRGTRVGMSTRSSGPSSASAVALEAWKAFCGPQTGRCLSRRGARLEFANGARITLASATLGHQV